MAIKNREERERERSFENLGISRRIQCKYREIKAFTFACQGFLFFSSWRGTQERANVGSTIEGEFWQRYYAARIHPLRGGISTTRASPPVYKGCNLSPPGYTRAFQIRDPLSLWIFLSIDLFSAPYFLRHQGDGGWFAVATFSHRFWFERTSHRVQKFDEFSSFRK